MLKNKNGITLIALVVTIIVLLILAGVAIMTLMGDNGIITRTSEAKAQKKISDIQEELQLAIEALRIDNITNNVGGTISQYIASHEEDLEKALNGEDVTISSNEITYKNRKFTIDQNGKITGSTVVSSSDNEVTVEVKPTETTPNSEVEFSMEFGTIDVIWLSGTTKNYSAIPNDPTPHLGGMTKVTWTEENDYSATEDATASSSWYSYNAGNGTSDNRTSHWANAKNSDGSYFVWIPRYAYRITYYDKDPSDSEAVVTGYYDGYGKWSAEGEVKNALDSGIDTADHDGKKYIVHPVFQTNLDNGGWSTALEGFWVAKYEMSRTNASINAEGDATNFQSKPNLHSAANMTIGTMYDNSLVYDSTKYSHLMKNSEWGAVAYLAHSQYGRNGKEIDINNSSSYVTGNGGGSTNALLAEGVTNAYNSSNGTKASTTGNAYGIYDISGGAYEYVAAFYAGGNDLSNGWTALATSTSSSQYATAYDYNSSEVSNHNETDLGGKIGDATKEVKCKNEWHQFGYPVDVRAWNNDSSSFVRSDIPFFERGGVFGSGSDGGLFYCVYNNGNADGVHSFRVVLAF